MIVGDQTEARAQLSSTIIDYHEPFDQGLKVNLQSMIANLKSCYVQAEYEILHCSSLL